MKKIILLALLYSMVTSVCVAQSMAVDIWGDHIVNYQPSDEKEFQDKDRNILWIEKIQKPSLQVFLPVKRNRTGQAVVICPGGGYKGVAYDWEGTEFAKYLNSRGVVAFVLKYRMPQSKSVKVSHKAPIQDAKRAIRWVRYNASKWGVNPDRVGVMGFSAGGHLASTLSTHFDKEDGFQKDEIDNLSARPDFSILVYPVITMQQPYTHMGSRNNLLGKKPERSLVNLYSNELNVDENTPPTFLLHATDDKGVPVENTLLYYQALKKAGVEAEVHIYPKGGHGFGLGLMNPSLKNWVSLLDTWMESLK